MAITVAKYIFWLLLLVPLIIFGFMLFAKLYRETHKMNRLDAKESRPVEEPKVSEYTFIKERPSNFSQQNRETK